MANLYGNAIRIHGDANVIQKAYNFGAPPCECPELYQRDFEKIIEDINNNAVALSNKMPVIQLSFSSRRYPANEWVRELYAECKADKIEFIYEENGWRDFGRIVFENGEEELTKFSSAAHLDYYFNRTPIKDLIEETYSNEYADYEEYKEYAEDFREQFNFYEDQDEVDRIIKDLLEREGVKFEGLCS